MPDSGDSTTITDISTYEASISILTAQSLQLDTGELEIRQDLVELAGLRLRRFRASRALREALQVADGWTSFVLPLKDREEVRWCGVPVAPRIIAILRAGPVHESLTPAGWDAIEIDVADALLEREGLVPAATFERALDPRQAALPLGPTLAAVLRRRLPEMLAQALTTAKAGRASETTALREGLIETLAGAVEQGCAHARGDQGTQAVSGDGKYRLVRRACAWLDARARARPTIESVAIDLSIDMRTLQRAFLGVLGITPKQYLLARKLDLARRELRRLGHRTTITDTAHRYGFTSSSRFAEQFRRQFGYAPSTLTRIECPPR